MTRFDAAMQRFDEFARERLQAAHIPGMVFALTDRDQLLFSSAFGFADLGARTGLTEEHLFEFGSIGKSFTCAVLMQLHDEGRIDLHAPVTDYLPWFAVRSRYEPITVHHLMSHTAGITGGTDFTPDPRYEVWALRETETSAQPGTYFHYSNAAYKALGLLLEEMLGASYADIVRERLLNPLGMHDTEPAITHATRPRLATAHAPLYDDRPWRPGQPLVPATWLETNTGDGCIAATAADLAAWMRMLLNHGAGPNGRVLSEQSFDLMTQRVIAVEGWGKDRSYGYGLATWEEDDIQFVGHGGGMVGYYSSLEGDLYNGLGAVAMVNGPGAAHEFTEYALKLARAALRDEPLPDPPSDDTSRIEDAADYAGRYRLAGSGSGMHDLHVVLEGDSLALEIGRERVALERIGGDAFYAAHQRFERFPLRFERAASEEAERGPVVELVHGPDWYAGERYSGPNEFEHPAEWTALIGHYRSHNPWMSNFRVLIRKDKLYFVHSSGHEEPLIPLDDGSFRVGEDERAPDRLRFDTIVNGVALRADFSGGPYYRFFTP